MISVTIWFRTSREDDFTSETSSESEDELYFSPAWNLRKKEELRRKKEELRRKKEELA